MRARKFVLLGLILILAGWVAPLQAAGPGGIIVRVNGGRVILQVDCLIAGCTITQSIDGTLGQLFLVTTPPTQDVNIILGALLNLPSIVDAELDGVAQVQGVTAPPALLDQTPTPYYGAMVPHGYVVQPASTLINLASMQAAYPQATGSGIVAIIDTGVDPYHPVLKPVLLPGYDYTRDQNGADETKDITLQSAPQIQGQSAQWVQGSGSGELQQSTAAVVDQSTAAVVDGNPQYCDFGHGTMVAGVVHLIAPTATILPLKAFSANGTGYLSNILRAIYAAMQQQANVINMSFNLLSYSPEMANALHLATLQGIVSVAAAGNSGENTLVYPAALSDVMGIASTNNNDQLSTFSNYGSQLVWVAAPGEGVVTTYPFSTYAAAWGTSFSTPMVSGTAAALRSVSSLLANQYSAANSTAHAQPISPDAGNGRLDLLQAVRSWSQANGGN